MELSIHTVTYIHSRIFIYILSSVVASMSKGSFKSVVVLSNVWLSWLSGSYHDIYNLIVKILMMHVPKDFTSTSRCFDP